MRPLRVFLCHASQDKPAVRKLHRYLKQRGVQPWLDELDLLPGENWEVEIPRALFSSDVILVCLSKNSVDKEGYVQKEITFALDKALEKPEGTIFIVPVKLEDCEVPRRLKQYQWVDVFRQDGYKRLMLGLQKRASGLGADVSPVVLEETRKTPKPGTKKPAEPIVSAPVPTEEVVKEEPKRETPTPQQEGKEPEAKFAQQKPFTKVLDPSSLVSNRILDSQRGDLITEGEKREDVLATVFNMARDEMEQVEKERAKHKRGRIFRLFGVVVIVLLVLIFGGFGLKYLVNNSPVPTATIFLTYTVTPKPPTSIPSRTPSPTPTLGIGSTMTGEHGETFVYVPAGEFKMGSDSRQDEAPIHTVYLDAFWVDQTEVTNKQYRACVDAGTCEPPSSIDSAIHANYYGNPEFDNSPSIYVTWDKANRYCEVWVGGDLLTEAQWEKAARGMEAFTYPWGNNVPNDGFLNYNSNVGDTTEVGKYLSGKSPYGIFDMAGNVWEWVNDYYQSDYYVALGDTAYNPLGPELGQHRVLRGGSWYTNANNSRSSFRYRKSPDYSDGDIGFRCARSVE